MVEQRKRMVGSTMSYMENADWWPVLQPEERKQLREHVLKSVNAYHDVVLDVLKAATPDVLVSDDAVRLLQAVHEGNSRIEGHLKDVVDR